MWVFGENRGCETSGRSACAVALVSDVLSSARQNVVSDKLKSFSLLLDHGVDLLVPHGIRYFVP